MMKLIKTNKNDDAKQYFQMLQKSGQANVFHYSIAMSYLCSTSNEQRELISKMKTEGLVPDVVTFTTLIKQLLNEGDKKAAHKPRLDRLKILISFLFLFLFLFSFSFSFSYLLQIECPKLQHL
jgi:hypothetical protein